MIDKHISKQNMQVINMLNTKYVITRNKNTGEKKVQLNQAALGNAWFVNRILWAENADKEIKLLDDFDPKNEVVIDSRYKNYFSKEIEDNLSTISLIDYKPNHITYKANVNNTESFAVFSEIYYEGSGNDWQAYINKKPVEHIRVNYLIRGMKIPNGEHVIEFKFKPPSYFVGEKISLIFSIIVILLFILALGLEFKQNKS